MVVVHAVTTATGGSSAAPTSAMSATPTTTGMPAAMVAASGLPWMATTVACGASPMDMVGTRGFAS